jgi:hypothetical protein
MPAKLVIVKSSRPIFLVFAMLSSAGCSGGVENAPSARPAPAAPQPASPATAAVDPGNERTPAAPSVAGGTDACAGWLSSNPLLQRYLAMPLAPADLSNPAAGQGAKRTSASAPALDEAERLAAAFHRVLLAFVERDAPALAAELPGTGQLTVVNTMEDLVGERDLPQLTRQLRARKGELFENMMAGEDDDYADRFSVRAMRSWCRRGSDFFVLGDDPSEVTFLRFSGGASPKLVAFGTAGL